MTSILPAERRTARLTSPLGDILLAFEPDALVGLYFEGQKHQPDWLAVLPDDAQHPIAQTTADWLKACFEGQHAAQAPALRLYGTRFQQAVWRALQAIPRGQTCTYAQVADAAGAPRAVPAGGSAPGRNPVSPLAVS